MAEVSCQHCGEPLWTAANPDSRPTHCPLCGNRVSEPARKSKPKPAPSSTQIQAGPTPSSTQIQAARTPDTAFQAEPPNRTGDDGDESYGVSGTIRRCSNCGRDLPDDGVLCVKCGYNSETGEQAMRVYEPIACRWEGALSYRRRLQLFAAAQVIGLLALAGAFLGDFLVVGLCTWLGYTAMLVYVLGTFDRLDASRTRRGRVSLTKTWRVCFVPRKPTSIAVHRHSGVVTGMANDVDGWDWFLLLIMFVLGGVPGILWWFCVFHRETFYVGLTGEHGAIAVELYRGWSEPQTRDIAKVARDLGGFS